MGTTKPAQTRIARYLPGISILFASAIVAWMVSTYIPPINELIISILIGAVLTNTVGIPEWALAGIQTHKTWLGTGIVLMGVSLSLDQVVENGPIILLSVFSIAILTALLIELLSRGVFDMSETLGSLLAAGASICGVSAVVAVAGSIDAKEEDIAYAAATILLFDALTILSYPVIGSLLDLQSQVFGIWVGTTMFSTGPVVAVGFAHSDVAGQWATITKLTRNTLIGLVAIVYATYYTRKRMTSDNKPKSGSTVHHLSKMWGQFPKFVLGFFILMIISTAGLLSSQSINSIENAYSWLFLLAFVGLGTEIDVQEFRSAGYHPILVILTSFIIMSVTSLSVLLVVFG